MQNKNQQKLVEIEKSFRVITTRNFQWIWAPSDVSFTLDGGTDARCKNVLLSLTKTFSRVAKKAAGYNQRPVTPSTADGAPIIFEACAKKIIQLKNSFLFLFHPFKKNLPFHKSPICLKSFCCEAAPPSKQLLNLFSAKVNSIFISFVDSFLFKFFFSSNICWSFRKFFSRSKIQVNLFL